MRKYSHKYNISRGGAASNNKIDFAAFEGKLKRPRDEILKMTGLRMVWWEVNRAAGENYPCILSSLVNPSPTSFNALLPFISFRAKGSIATGNPLANFMRSVRYGACSSCNVFND
jgi:hypothetical protein